MRIVYRGNFGVSFSTESHIAASLEHLGHTVVRCQENDVAWPEQVGICAHASDPADLFLWTSTHSYARKWRTDDERATVEMLNRMLPTAAVHLDLFFGLKRAKQVSECSWFHMSTVFTADGDHAAEFKDAGVNHHWLLPAVFHKECELGTYREECASDIAFVGAHTSGYHREYAGRMQLVSWLKKTYGDRCAFYPKHGKPAVRGQELNDLYASVKVVVGDSCFADTSVNYTSDRVFETVGRGGFLLYPRIPCVEAELLDGVHLAYFPPGDFDSLEKQIGYWTDPAQAEERLTIRKAGCAYVAKNCTYLNRLQTMLDVMGLG